MQQLDVAKLIKEAREKKALSRVELSKKAQVPLGVIKKLEEGRYDELPESFYLSHFLERLAQVLSLEKEILFSLFKEEHPPDISGVIVSKVPSGRENKWGFWILGLALVVLCIGIISYISFIPNWELKRPNIEMEIEKEIKKTKNFSTHLNTVKETSAALPNFAAASQEPLQTHILLIKAHERCWVHINLENGDERDFILQPGERYKINYIQKCTVRLGNSGGIDIFVDGEKTSIKGERGRPLTLLFEGKKLLSPSFVKQK